MTTSTADMVSAKADSFPWVPVVGLVLVILVGAGGYGIVKNNRLKTAEASRDALFVAQQSYDDELKIVGTLKPTMDADVSFPLALTAFDKVAMEFPKTVGGFEARMMRGTLYFETKKYDKALNEFKLASESAPSPLEEAIANHSHGLTMESLNQYQEAMNLFEAAAPKVPVAMKGEFLMSAARNALFLGDTTKAKALFARVKSEAAESSQAKAADEELMKLTGAEPAAPAAALETAVKK